MSSLVEDAVNCNTALHCCSEYGLEVRSKRNSSRNVPLQHKHRKQRLNNYAFNNTSIPRPCPGLSSHQVAQPECFTFLEEELVVIPSESFSTITDFDDSRYRHESDSQSCSTCLSTSLESESDFPHGSHHNHSVVVLDGEVDRSGDANTRYGDLEVSRSCEGLDSPFMFGDSNTRYGDLEVSRACEGLDSPFTFGDSNTRYGDLEVSHVIEGLDSPFTFGGSNTRYSDLEVSRVIEGLDSPFTFRDANTRYGDLEVSRVCEGLDSSVTFLDVNKLCGDLQVSLACEVLDSSFKFYEADSCSGDLEASRVYEDLDSRFTFRDVNIFGGDLEAPRACEVLDSALPFCEANTPSDDSEVSRGCEILDSPSTAHAVNTRLGDVEVSQTDASRRYPGVEDLGACYSGEVDINMNFIQLPTKMPGPSKADVLPTTKQTVASRGTTFTRFMPSYKKSRGHLPNLFDTDTREALSGFKPALHLYPQASQSNIYLIKAGTEPSYCSPSHPFIKSTSTSKFGTEPSYYSPSHSCIKSTNTNRLGRAYEDIFPSKETGLVDNLRDASLNGSVARPTKDIRRPVAGLPWAVASRLPVTPFSHELRREKYLSPEVVHAFHTRNYKLGEVLGMGISSTVRRVTEKITGIEYAVKIIDISGEKGELIQVDQIKRDTFREIAILRMTAEHPNIIELHDVFETPTFIFLVFEICKKGELFDYLTSVVSLSEKRTRIFMRQLIEAVAFLHDKNIVHRDLKPENILLDDSLNIKVSDFGFATVIQDGEELTELCGTPGYLAPEVLAQSMYENVSGYGKEVDMWACGVIMYTLLCGAPPFWHRRQMMMLRSIMAADYTFNSPEWDDITDAPKNLIKKLLVVNPKERLTAKQALLHPFFHSPMSETKRKFQARRKFKAGVKCIIFYLRLIFYFKHPPPVSVQMVRENPYGIKVMRKVIDTCAFSMYKHWVKRVDNQNRAALFEHTLRDDWKHTLMTVDGVPA